MTGILTALFGPRARSDGRDVRELFEFMYQHGWFSNPRPSETQLENVEQLMHAATAIGNRRA